MKTLSQVTLRCFRRSGFTLVEVLVAITVLSIILVMLAQMAGLVNKASYEGLGRVDNFTKSRAMLDLVASDLQHAVIRSDLPIFQSGGILSTNSGGGFTDGVYAAALFTCVPGIPSSSVAVRDVSLVTYAITNNSSEKVLLERSDLAVPWSGATTNLSFQGDLGSLTNSVTARDMVAGVVGFQFSFRRADGTISTSYTGYNLANPVVAVGVTLAVIGEQALDKMSVPNLQQIENMLANVTPISTNNIAGVEVLWNEQLTPNFYQLYPKDLATDFKTFERWIVFPQPF